MNMSKIVRSAADVLFPFIIIFGLYIISHGHLTPGGGFQGGAVVATAFVMIIVAYNYREIAGRLRKTIFTPVEAMGLITFIVVALLGITAGAGFFYNWLANTGSLFGLPVAFGSNPGMLNTGGVVPLMNLAVGMEVLAGLTLIVLYMLSGIKEAA